ncbi:MAG: hypothetical protein PUB73_02555 [Bacteroidales bacterium]|nr:hypothetical protein [Bacteroidales bacterium]
MKSTTLQIYLTAFILILAQGITDSFVDISRYVLISFLPFITLRMPYKSSTPAVLLVSFVAGLVADFLGGGIIGLNSASLTFAGLLRGRIIKTVVGKDVIEKEKRPSVLVTGQVSFLIYSALLIALYELCYIFLDSMGSASFLFNLTRFAISVPVNTAISMLLFNLCTNNPRQ